METMNVQPMRIAISGLHRGENPQPGAGIVRSLRRRFPDAFIVGLVYDAMESGIYVEGGPDVVYAMPYPTAGADVYLQRLDEILARTPFDFFLPTLDAEIELLAYLESGFASRGLTTCLPEVDSLHRRSKNHLSALAEECDVEVPETEAIYDLSGARRAVGRLGYPCMVKGQYYDARRVVNDIELASAVNKLLGEWGAPAILQRCINGPEFNAMGIGDGEGGIIGLCCIRKTILSDKGKGCGAITIRDEKLERLCQRLISALQWRGPFEIEVMMDEEIGDYSLIEINPRFPAWVDFPSQFGVNFPAALFEMMSGGKTPAALPVCQPGHFYVRHQIEVLGHVDQLAELATSVDFSALPVHPV